MTLDFASPVLTAAGCGGTGRELDAVGGLDGLGGFVTRSITLDPRAGGPSPRLVESPAGFVNAIGLQNPGVDLFLTRELPWFAARQVRCIVSIAGSSLGEYADIARRLAPAPGLGGIEVNLSVPDAADLGLLAIREPFQAARVVAAVRRDLPQDVPVLAKLGPDPARIVETSRAVAEAGASAVVLVNSAPALLPDGRTGGLSGPAIRPLALRCVHDVHGALPDLAVIGSGGVLTHADLREFLRAGAIACQVGSGLLHDPTCAARLAAETRGD